MAYYVKLQKEIDRWTPFVSFDTLTDDDDPVYRARGNRLGTGVGYRINDNTYLKGEYHFSNFSNDDKLRTATSSVNDISHMAHMSLIYVF